MVPKNWAHPKDESGRYKPMYDRSYDDDLAKYQEEKQQWLNGFREKWGAQEGESKWQPKSEEEKLMSFEDWAGCEPDPDYYMPDFNESDRTHYQMYEDTSEGTPISPPMETPEELAEWLVDNNASAFGRMTATYDEWLNMINAKWAPSMIYTNGKLDSGVSHA